MDRIDTSIHLAADRAREEGFISNTTDGDFMAKDGKAYRDMDDHAIRDTFNGIEARLAALSWLVKGTEWDYERGNVAFQTPMGSLWSATDV